MHCTRHTRLNPPRACQRTHGMTLLLCTGSLAAHRQCAPLARSDGPFVCWAATFFFSFPPLASTVRAVATATAPGTRARIRSVSAHLCPRAAPSATCSVRKNWVADGVGNSTNRNGDAKTIAECCDACTRLRGCALFVATPNAIDGHGCVLWSATGVGGKVVQGAVTGSPRR